MKDKKNIIEKIKQMFNTPVEAPVKLADEAPAKEAQVEAPVKLADEAPLSISQLTDMLIGLVEEVANLSERIATLEAPADEKAPAEKAPAEEAKAEEEMSKPTETEMSLQARISELENEITLLSAQPSTEVILNIEPKKENKILAQIERQRANLKK